MLRISQLRVPVPAFYIKARALLARSREWLSLSWHGFAPAPCAFSSYLVEHAPNTGAMARSKWQEREHVHLAAELSIKQQTC